MARDDGYELLDSGAGRKLERFGRVVLARPAAQAVWRPALPEAEWAKADASFDREEGNRWQGRGRLPDHWTIDVDGTRFHLSATDFGHLGIFPEQRAQWAWLRKELASAPGARVLNLFAYSGGSSLACARAGAAVTHLDASRGMVDWAAENAKLNGLSTIRFVRAREQRRDLRHRARPRRDARARARRALGDAPLRPPLGAHPRVRPAGARQRARTGARGPRRRDRDGRDAPRGRARRPSAPERRLRALDGGPGGPAPGLKGESGSGRMHPPIPT